MPRVRFLARRALRAALAPLVLAVAPLARAEAQPACVAGTLASYTAAGFSCTLGGYRVHKLGFDGSAHVQDGAEALAVDPALTMLRPFTSVDAAGRTTFGFDLVDFTVAAGSHGTTGLVERSEAYGGLGFWLAPLAPQTRLVAAHLEGAFDGFNRTSDLLVTETVVGANVDQVAGSGYCPTWWVQPGIVGSSTFRVGGTCTAPLDGEIVVAVAASAQAARLFDGTEPIDGFTLGAATRVEFTQATVPEPGTVALLGGGLVAMLGAGRARARRARAA